MGNTFFELDRLRDALINKGLERGVINTLVSKASREIQEVVEQQGAAAIEQAIEAGIEKGSADFINELRLDSINFELTTESGNMEFTIPARPMLSSLLKNAKPMKDGSGVYKVIPIGKSSGEGKPKVSSNIFDAQKKIAAQRAEAAKANYASAIPSGSKGGIQFRVATSKQDANTKWVQPAKEMNFKEEVKDINLNLRASIDDQINDIINSYLEMF